MLRLVQNITPAKVPIDLNIAKAQLIKDDEDTYDDGLVTGMIRAATAVAETFLNRALITQTWTSFYDHWLPGISDDGLFEGARDGADISIVSPKRDLDLPKPPLQSVVLINTYDDDDVATLYAASNYFVDTATEPGRVVLRRSASAPTTQRVANGIEIQFVAGYGDNPGDVPEDIRQGIMMTVAHLYENRGEDPAMAAKLTGAHALWTQHRIMRF